VSEVSLLVALLAGLLSFLSPCVLPIVPAYIGRLAALADDESPTLHAILFTAGFTTLFAVLGLGAAYAGGALGRLLPSVQLPLGLAMIAGGLHLAGVIRIPLLDRGGGRRAVTAPGRVGSALLGVAFAAAWTPCIGIVLGSILALAATGSDPLGAALLLISYGLGLGLPVIALALLAGRAAPLLARARRFTALGGRLGGALVVIIGALVASGSLPALSRLLPGLGGL
jgi:cytochrome c-type biogenesis protein